MQSPLYSKIHVAIIMDGNGRWAIRRGLSRDFGHEAGVEAVRRVVESAPDQGVGTLTLFAFSCDNWRRPKTEVAALMGLLRRYLRAEAAQLVRSGTHLSVIGRRDRLPKDLLIEIEQAEAATISGDKLNLRIGLDYSGRDAILSAAARATSAEQLTRAGFARLVTGEPAPRDVDLLIRSSGEKRLSDFLLWESAYAELYFTDVMWPDFGAQDLADALACFKQRERRFGGLIAPAA